MNDAVLLLLPVPEYGKKDIGCEAIDVPDSIAERVKGFGIREVVHQVREPFGYFVRIIRGLLVSLPAFDIALDELSFTHQVKIKHYCVRKAAVSTVLQPEAYICHMSVITVTTPFNIDLEFRIAPFHKRLLAWLIDLLLMYTYVFLINRYIVAPLSAYEELGTTITIMMILIPAYSYHLIMEVFFNGQSLGKKAMGIKVMDINGNEASFSQYLLRWLFRIFDMLMTLGAAAVLSAALSKYGQRLGDMVAGTVVIDSRYRTDISDTIYLEVEDTSYEAVFPEVMKLSDRDINGIRNLLDAKGTGKDTEVYMDQVAVRIKEVLKLETQLTPRQLLEQLLKDYNYITRK